MDMGSEGCMQYAIHQKLMYSYSMMYRYTAIYTADTSNLMYHPGSGHLVTHMLQDD